MDLQIDVVATIPFELIPNIQCIFPNSHYRIWHQLVLKNIVGIMAFLNVFAVKLSLVAENVLCPAKP